MPRVPGSGQGALPQPCLHKAFQWAVVFFALEPDPLGAAGPFAAAGDVILLSVLVSLDKELLVMEEDT